MRISDWSSDVCSSDLAADFAPVLDQIERGLLVRQRDVAPAPIGIGTPLVEESGQPVRRHMGCAIRRVEPERVEPETMNQRRLAMLDRIADHLGVAQIGRASWRERVCQYV